MVKSFIASGIAPLFLVAATLGALGSTVQPLFYLLNSAIFDNFTPIAWLTPAFQGGEKTWSVCGRRGGWWGGPRQCGTQQNIHEIWARFPTEIRPKRTEVGIQLATSDIFTTSEVGIWPALKGIVCPWRGCTEPVKTGHCQLASGSGTRHEWSARSKKNLQCFPQIDLAMDEDGTIQGDFKSVDGWLNTKCALEKNQAGLTIKITNRQAGGLDFQIQMYQLAARAMGGTRGPRWRCSQLGGVAQSTAIVFFLAQMNLYLHVHIYIYVCIYIYIHILLCICVYI